MPANRQPSGELHRDAAPLRIEIENLEPLLGNAETRAFPAAKRRVQFHAGRRQVDPHDAGVDRSGEAVRCFQIARHYRGAEAVIRAVHCFDRRFEPCNRNERDNGAEYLFARDGRVLRNVAEYRRRDEIAIGERRFDPPVRGRWPAAIAAAI